MVCLFEVSKSLIHVQHGEGGLQGRGGSEGERGGSGEDQEQGRKVEFDHVNGIDGCAVEV